MFEVVRTKQYWSWPAALLLAAVTAVAQGGPAASERGYIDHPAAPNAAALPFSDAVRSGDTLFIAGHIGIDPATGNAAAAPETEARLVMDAVKQTLTRAGYSMDEVTTLTIYCTDLSLYETFNKVYAGYFKGHFPARAFIGVDKLVRGAHFEVQGTAVKAQHP